MTEQRFAEAVLSALTDEYSREYMQLPQEQSFSAGFEKKMNRLIKRRRRVIYPLISTAMRRAACLLVIIGAGLILYLTAFGFQATGRFINETVVRILTVSALTFYCFAKSYSFYTGANHLPSVITTGTPGAILSAGLIVYLNICVGIVVACTMYSFYALFRKGGF